MRWEALREGQREAIRTAEELIAAGKECISIVLPCRYGKSRVMQLLSIRAVEASQACCSLAFAPWALIRDGLNDPDEWDVAREVSGVQGNVAHTSFERVPSTTNWVPNGELFIVSCIGLLLKNVSLYVDFIEAMVRKTGLPVLVHWDECHIGTPQTMEWGKALQALRPAGAVIILYTATENREDGLEVPGFECVGTPIVPTKVYKRRYDEEAQAYIREEWSAMRFEMALVPDHKTSFAEAWQETPSPICLFTRLPFDVELTEFEAEDRYGGVLLSALAPTTAKRLLRPIVTGKRAIRRGRG